MFSVVYYSCCSPPDYLRLQCFEQIREATGNKAEIITVFQDYAPVWALADKNSHALCIGARKRGLASIYEQMLAGIEAATYDLVYMVEDDVLYPASHFRGWETDHLVYDTHLWRMEGDIAWPDYPRIIGSGLCGHRNALSMAIRYKQGEMKQRGKVKWSEVGWDDPTATITKMPGDVPIIDIRWGGNLTGGRRKHKASHAEKPSYAEIPGWGKVIELNEMLGL